MEEGERFMIREEENVSEEGVKGSEKAAIGANQNNMNKARVGRVRLICKCVPPCDPRQWWQAPSPSGDSSRSGWRWGQHLEWAVERRCVGEGSKGGARCWWAGPWCASGTSRSSAVR